MSLISTHASHSGGYDVRGIRIPDDLFKMVSQAMLFEEMTESIRSGPINFYRRVRDYFSVKPNLSKLSLTNIYIIYITIIHNIFIINEGTDSVRSG